jgi:hypothetical protein
MDARGGEERRGEEGERAGRTTRRRAKTTRLRISLEKTHSDHNHGRVS